MGYIFIHGVLNYSLEQESFLIVKATHNEVFFLCLCIKNLASLA
jgi:hypothetical protein